MSPKQKVIKAHAGAHIRKQKSDLGATEYKVVTHHGSDALGLGISWYRSPHGEWFAAAMYVKEPKK